MYTKFINDLEPWTYRKLIDAGKFIPYWGISSLCHFSTRKLTMFFSNINASKIPYKLNGNEAKTTFIIA